MPYEFKHADLLIAARHFYDACLIKQYERDEVDKINADPNLPRASSLQIARATDNSQFLPPRASGKGLGIATFDAAVSNLKNATTPEEKLKAQIQIVFHFTQDVGLCPPGTTECNEGCCSQGLSSIASNELWL